MLRYANKIASFSVCSNLCPTSIRTYNLNRKMCLSNKILVFKNLLQICICNKRSIEESVYRHNNATQNSSNIRCINCSPTPSVLCGGLTYLSPEGVEGLALGSEAVKTAGTTVGKGGGGGREGVSEDRERSTTSWSRVTEVPGGVSSGSAPGCVTVCRPTVSVSAPTSGVSPFTFRSSAAIC